MLSKPRGISGFFYSLNAEHSGDLGMATKEPWKGRPAAIGRVLLRLVNLVSGCAIAQTDNPPSSTIPLPGLGERDYRPLGLT